MNIIPLSIAEVRHVAHILAQKHLDWGEPIPDFETRYPQVLERCVFAPFQTFEGQLYKGLIEKSAIFFYLMIKNHPFQNGNKRIAVVSLLVLLSKNKKWISMDTKELYNFAKWVAESDPDVKDEVLLAIQRKVKKSLVDFKGFK